MAAYRMRTCNLETGAMNQLAPEGHWRNIALLMADKLRPEQLADLQVAQKLYIDHLAHIKTRRCQLLVELTQRLSEASQVEVSSLGYWKQSSPQGTTAQFKLLAALDANLRQESQLEAGLRHVCTKVMEPVQAAKVKVTSWPFIPDYPAILEGILQDRHTIA
eukprot:jgi/Chrzof1/5024/Cz15g08270.t1